MFEKPLSLYKLQEERNLYYCISYRGKNPSILYKLQGIRNLHHCTSYRETFINVQATGGRETVKYKLQGEEKLMYKLQGKERVMYKVQGRKTNIIVQATGGGGGKGGA